MKRKYFAFLIAAAFGTTPINHAIAADKPEDCAAIADGGERLICYDAIFRVHAAAIPSDPAVPSKWSVQVETSKIDDSKGVFLVLESDDDFPGKYGNGVEHATLVIRCMENKTAMTLQLGTRFLADTGGYGDVTLRVDDKKAITKSFDESTDHSALGLFSTSKSVPVIKLLLGGNRLIVRATPYNESAITVTFSMTGLDQAIKGLRETCNW